jgi:hypothetical protein
VPYPTHEELRSVTEEALRAASEEALRAHRVRLVAKADSRLMRAAGVLLRGIGNRDFNARYWTTVGRTVYYPTSVSDPLAHPDILDHELVHVRQWQSWGVLMWASYLLLPLPFGLAWFRFRWEREAYLVQIARADDREREIERVVQVLWYGYGWPWPRASMRKWFEQHAPRK